MLVSVEPGHEEDAERHVHQHRHHRVGFPVDEEASLQEVLPRLRAAPNSPRELNVTAGGAGRADRPHVLTPVAELDAGGQFGGQESQREDPEDPAGQTEDQNFPE